MQTHQACSDDLLREMLNSDSQAEQFETLLQHIERCPYCQQRLDQLAASDDHWELVAQSFSGFSSEQAFRSLPSNATIPSRRPDAHWTELMARQLLAPASHPEMLGRIGRYEVERLIGSGGMGIVFKAIDTELNRPVAIKILAPYLAGCGAARQRFAREAKAAAAVVHEHVVPIHNVEADGESPFLVMRYVAGESLQMRIDRDGAMDICQILRIAYQIASGLSAAHAQGLVHRDIKPSNILVESGVERSLITDFGLARAADDASLTNTGYHPGTPQFMSPEQARGDPIDARSDLFSLGSVMYTMCTGRPPFRAETSYGVLRRITDDEPREIRELNPLIPNWLCGTIAKLMSKAPTDRFQSAEEVAVLLELCLAHVQHPTTCKLPLDAVSLGATATNRLRYLVPLLAVSFAALAIALLVEAWWPTIRNGTFTVETPVRAPESFLDPNSKKSFVGQHSDAKVRQSQPIVRAPRQQPPLTPEDRIRQKLAVHTEVDFESLPFQEGVAAILATSDVKFNVLATEFEAAETDAFETCSLKSSGTYFSLLHRLCARYRASYIVRETNIDIVPVDYAQANPILRYYDLAFVLPDSRNTQSVIQAIEQSIDPAQWVDQGGVSSIRLVDSVILVRAPESTHHEIERLLSQIAVNFLSSASQ